MRPRQHALIEAIQTELEAMRAEVETLKAALQAVEGGDPATLKGLLADSVLESHQLRRRVAACPHCGGVTRPAA